MIQPKQVSDSKQMNRSMSSGQNGTLSMYNENSTTNGTIGQLPPMNQPIFQRRIPSVHPISAVPCFPVEWLRSSVLHPNF